MSLKERKCLNSKPYGKRAIKAMAVGLAGLLESQLRLMDEVGLSFRDFYPVVYELSISGDLVSMVEGMLTGGTKGSANLTSLFSALSAQQRFLLNSLDHVALQSCDLLQSDTLISCLRRKCKRGVDYKSNAELRYKKIIVPSLISSFLCCHEARNDK